MAESIICRDPLPWSVAGMRAPDKLRSRERGQSIWSPNVRAQRRYRVHQVRRRSTTALRPVRQARDGWGEVGSHRLRLQLAVLQADPSREGPATLPVSYRELFELSLVTGCLKRVAGPKLFCEDAAARSTSRDTS